MLLVHFFNAEIEILELLEEVCLFLAVLALLLLCY